MRTPAFALLVSILLLSGCQWKPGETRAVWVVRDAMVSPEAVAQVIEDAVQGGFNTLLVQVRGRGDAYYRSDLVPRAKQLARQPASFDPLRLTIELARKRGLAVHGWINLLLVSNLSGPPGPGTHVALRHPEWLVLPAALLDQIRRLPAGDPRRLSARSRHYLRTRKADGLFLDPALLEVQEHILEVIRELVSRYAMDGLHLDYVRYPGADPGYGLKALPRFLKLNPEISGGAGSPSSRDSVALVQKHSALWDQFRRHQVTALVTRIQQEVKHLAPNMLLSAAVVADAELAHSSRLQDWKQWVETGILDVVCPMAYTPDPEIFEDRIRIARQSSSRSRLWAGIGAYKLDGEGILQQVRLSRQLGADGFVVFSYNTLAASKKSREELLEPLGAFLRSEPR